MSEENSNDHVLILGGGISGLTTAWFLQKAGVPFTLIEKENKTGGVISSSEIEGTIVDYGPNSLRDRDGILRALAAEIGLEDDIIEISEAFKTRYIVRDRELQELLPSPKTLFTTNVLSAKGKWRVLAEPFISKGTAADESVGSFLERRIGKEAVDYLVDPVFSGIYAGDIYSISKKKILPKLAQNEQKFGSLVMGVLRNKKERSDIKPAVLSFKKGVQQLAEALESKLADHTRHEKVLEINKPDIGFQVKTEKALYDADQVISCLPAHKLESLLVNFDPDLSKTLNEIAYSPMMSTQLIFRKEDIDFKKSGFGFLIPRKEDIRLLGAIWKTSIFPELSHSDHFHFTLMTGGAHDTSILNESVGDIEKEILREFSGLTGIAHDPLYIRSVLWEKAIPQFHVGYEKILQKLENQEQRYLGLHFGGNYRWGVSVPDCIKGAKTLVQQYYK
ncbi:MAG: protoporphyrinogen oxidase [Gracilimonas sp.]|uniref:protoporphyrinogen oxidase n=1 Tax=Gracilimonas sp. TaxID=1974203 RepID=UPI0037520006|nr:protoporphyrinogen oxidase [Gracilimonas sp.]